MNISWKTWMKLSYISVLIALLMDVVGLISGVVFFGVLWIAFQILYVIQRQKDDSTYDVARMPNGIRQKTFDYIYFGFMAVIVIWVCFGGLNDKTVVSLGTLLFYIVGGVFLCWRCMRRKNDKDEENRT